MSSSVLTAREILEEFHESIWFEMVLGMKHEIKEIIPLIVLLAKDGLIDFDTNRRTFDKYIRDYEHCIVTYITRAVRKDLNVSSQFVAAGDSAGPGAVAAVGSGNRDVGQATWLRDLFGDAGPDILAGLDSRSKANCI